MRKVIKNPYRAMAVAGVVTLVASGCGARLTQAQMQALDNGGGTGSSGVAAGNGATGTGATGTGASGGGGSTTGGATTGGSSVAGGGTSSSGGGTSVGGGRTGGAAGGTAAQGGASQSGGTVTAANNPLAGPGGKVCKPGAPGSGPGVTPSTITVGNIATINGPVPGLFAGARYGAQAVAAYINSMGGICGRQLQVDAEDDQFDQATDQQEAASMSSNVLGFMGSFSLQDGGIPAGAPGVPDFGEALSSARFNSASNFSPQPQAPGYNTGEYVYLKAKPQYAAATQKMAMLIEDTSATLTTGQEEEKALESVGYKFIFTDDQLQPTDPTFDNDVAKMKAAGVQGVIFQATATVIGQLANAMYADGFTVPLGNWCPSAYDPAFIQNAGPGVAGTILSQSFALYDGEDASAIPMVSTLDQWYARVNPGQVPDIYAVYAWESGLMLAMALNEEGSVTRSSLLAGVQTLTNFTGDGLQATSNPVTKSPPSCYLFITVTSQNKFARTPDDPSNGFICNPAGYFHAS
jgi:ABC-type branched-subunit amino acid transport system substrate-binding protein